jgi:hypothetical protein
MPRGTSRQVKPRPKHTKAKKHHKLQSRSARLGGPRPKRLQAARTGPLPHLQDPCQCPCQQPATPGPPAPIPPVQMPNQPGPAPNPAMPQMPSATVHAGLPAQAAPTGSMGFAM